MCLAPGTERRTRALPMSLYPLRGPPNRGKKIQAQGYKVEKESKVFSWRIS